MTEDEQNNARPIWRGQPRMGLVGYARELSVVRGDEVHVQISCDAPEYRAEVLRLRHGADHPAGPGVREFEHDSSIAGRHTGRRQALSTGSYMQADGGRVFGTLTTLSAQAWIYPTLVGGAPRGIMSRWGGDAGGGFAVVLGEQGDLELWLGDGGECLDVLRTDVPILESEWTFVAVSIDLDVGSATLIQRPLHRWPHADSDATRSLPVRSKVIADCHQPLLVAAVGGPNAALHHFDGKIEGPRLDQRALTIGELEAGSRAAPQDLHATTLAAWDFSVGIETRSVQDRSPNALHGVLVNMPARGVTGRWWTGDESDWTRAPDQYAAVHFHSDDLEDAGWETDLVVPIDETYQPGVYAVHVSAGAYEDRIPFVVRPSTRTRGARLVVLLPTLTYQAYANAQVFGGPGAKVEQAEDQYVRQHGLRSLYDYHVDGSPVYYASRLRPSTMRPGYYAQNIGAPARLSADLCLIDWLTEQGIAHDIVTDEDLHHEGTKLIAEYGCVATGSHPEYWTKPMVDAIEAYIAGGGNLAYLGGNGCYWVTSLHPENAAVVEVRRGESGTRTQSARPGEYHLSSTGELGGMWRSRGHAPQLLFGVGMTAWGIERGAGYRRLPASHDPRVAFVFDGVGDDEIIGDFGIMLDGAAGYEIDRLDRSLGSPPHALVLATSAGQHSPAYVPATEEMTDALEIETARERCVRADMVFFETGHGGAVFSTGSITWVGSLSYNNYGNSVSRVTRNVLQRFLTGIAFAVPSNDQ